MSMRSHCTFASAWSKPMVPHALPICTAHRSQGNGSREANLVHTDCLFDIKHSGINLVLPLSLHLLVLLLPASFDSLGDWKQQNHSLDRLGDHR